MNERLKSLNRRGLLDHRVTYAGGGVPEDHMVGR